MKRLGLAVAALVAACSPAVFADAVSAQSYTSETVLPAVGTGGLEPLMSDYARENSDPAEQARLLRVFAELGPLVSAEEVSCNVRAQVNTNPDLNGTFAICAGGSTYRNAAAQVQVQLRKAGDAWQLDAVNVNSDYFSKLMEKGMTAAPDAAGERGPATPAPKAPVPTNP